MSRQPVDTRIALRGDVRHMGRRGEAADGASRTDERVTKVIRVEQAVQIRAHDAPVAGDCAVVHHVEHAGPAHMAERPRVPT